jgi:putative flippase GtrA
MKALLWQTARFGIVGALNTILGLGAIYGFMLFLHLRPALANALGYAIGFVVSFLLNRAWTFASRQRLADVLPRYILAVACCYLLNLATVLLTQGRASPYLAQLLGVAIYSVTLFAASRWFVFAAPPPHPPS